MSAKHEPEWEVVEEIPGEKPSQQKSGGLTAIFKNKILWIGLLSGAALVILVPFFRVMLQNAVRAWWIWVGLALYWLWRRVKKNVQRR